MTGTPGGVDPIQVEDSVTGGINGLGSVEIVLDRPVLPRNVTPNKEQDRSSQYWGR